MARINIEDAYADRWSAGRVSKDVWKYVPDRAKPGVSNAFADSDGYWVWLWEDWTAYDGGEDCGTIHEYTVSGLKEAVKTIRKIK